MKKLIIFSFFLVCFSIGKAQTSSAPTQTKAQVHEQFRTEHPDEEILTDADNPESRTEDPARMTCWSIGWSEPGPCIGYTTYCHHSFLGIGWWTEHDTYVYCP